MIPLIDGRLLHFGHRGLYNGLSILGDRDTGSYWDHITGECILGPLQGRRMQTGPLTHMTAEQADVDNRDMLLAASRPNLFGRWMGRIAELTRLTRRGFLPPGFRRTMGQVDARLPEMQIGLGVWTDRVQRFYPIDDIASQPEGVLTDSLDSCEIVVRIDRRTRIPSAEFLNRQADPTGPVRRPMQLFTRWYGFSLTFAGCEIYGQ